MQDLQARQEAFALELKQLQQDGTFAGYAAVFDVVDNQRDIILQGAFSRTLQLAKDIKLLWQHDTKEPIGVFTQIREDAHGLYVEGRLLLDVQRAREAYALMKEGALSGLSIGYGAKHYDIDPDTGVRVISDVELFEVSVVTFPANEAARVTQVKSPVEMGIALPQTVREFEQFLRLAGWSRGQAKAIAGKGFLASTVSADEQRFWDAAMVSGKSLELCDALVRAERTLALPQA